MTVGGVQKRLGTSFHETFALNRPAMSQVLAIAAASPELVSFDGLRANTNLGRNYVKSMPRYCFGSGLLDSKNKLTPFGLAAVEYDPALQKPETQWLMHFFLALSDGPGPRFWHDVVTGHLRVGSTVSADEVAGWVAGSVAEAGDRELAERTLRDSARVFLKTYSRDDGLGQIGLVYEVERSRYLYEVRVPSQPATPVIECAIAFLWANRWPGRVTANLLDLTETLCEIFLLGQDQLMGTLRDLQRQRAIELWRVAPPFQVAKTSLDDNQVWVRLYD